MIDVEVHRTDEGKPASATITGLDLLEPVEVGPGSVIKLEDWVDRTDSIVILQVDRLEETDDHGVIVHGVQYSEDPTLLRPRPGIPVKEQRQRAYIGQRAMPLSRILLSQAGTSGPTVGRRRVSVGGARAPQSRARAGNSIFVGRCHHCGGPTGGTFQPGHDAKLKGELIREATTEAWAERVLRGWTTIQGHEPEELKRGVAKFVKQGDEFLRQRVQERVAKRKEGDDQ